MTTTTTAHAPRLHTIGSVCRRLQSDFPDISISKIRYLEDQGLLSPKRTRGGYRLFSEDDIDRLETILRLQRDEFLPLRVIRQELASPTAKDRRRRRAGLRGQETEIHVDELCARAGISAEQARELTDYGLLDPPLTEADADTAAVCSRLVAAGADVRHLRKFATAAGNQADLLEALVPKLHSRNPEARQGAIEDLHGLAQLAQELNQLLFWRALRGARDMTVDLAKKIRDVPDFPKPGIVFKDIMPLLADPDALRAAVDEIADWAAPRKPDLVLGAEARGYITGGALACRLGCGFVAARKPGKLPWWTVAAKYALEYGFDSLEIHADAIVKGQRVVIHDDVLATGGTAKATVELVEQLGGEVVGLPFIIELEFLNGRERLEQYDVFSLLQY